MTAMASANVPADIARLDAAGLAWNALDSRSGAEEETPAGIKRRSGYAGARRSVLVVDNEEVDRELLRQLLEPLGFVVAQASSGEAALQLLRDGARPDAILMDLAMPG